MSIPWLEYKNPLRAPGVVGQAVTLSKCIYLAHSFTVSAVPALQLLLSLLFFFLISAEPTLLVPDTTPGVKPSSLGVAAQKDSPGL